MKKTDRKGQISEKMSQNSEKSEKQSQTSEKNVIKRGKKEWQKVTN